MHLHLVPVIFICTNFANVSLLSRNELYQPHISFPTKCPCSSNWAGIQKSAAVQLTSNFPDSWGTVGMSEIWAVLQMDARKHHFIDTSPIEGVKGGVTGSCSFGNASMRWKQLFTIKEQIRQWAFNVVGTASCYINTTLMQKKITYFLLHGILLACDHVCHHISQGHVIAVH